MARGLAGEAVKITESINNPGIEDEGGLWEIRA
jgi:hypothetical protein